MRENLYEIITLISETPEKQLFLVRHQLTRMFYIKKIFPHPQELSLYMQLKKHPHIHMPKIIEVENQMNRCIIIEEFVNGVTLEYAMSANNFTMENIEMILMELFDVLIHLHSLVPQIVHRDIKPGNIMLEKGHVKLIDFEIARKVCDEKSRDTQIIGSVGYAAPEQYGFAQSDQRSDVYAVGVLMKELLGQRKEGQAYENIISKCTQIDPNKRYQRVEELRNDVRKILTNKSKPAYEPIQQAKPSYAIPGFDQDVAWKRILYLTYYAVVLIIAFNAQIKTTTTLLLWLERISIAFSFLLIAWIPNNVGNMLHALPLYRSEYKLIRMLNGALVWLIYTLILLIFVGFLNSLIVLFLKSV